ncbi:hypothetical protein ACFPPF_02830 [Xenophilus aerolatus]|nr:hypothetical protein [Xenophilus aerolatus]
MGTSERLAPRRARLRGWALAATLSAAALAAPAQQPAGAPVLRASTEQNLVIHASGDPRLPHLFSVDGDAAASQRRRWVVSVNVALEGAQDFDRRLAQELAAPELGPEVLLEDFRPPHAPRCVELQIGSRVPVSLVQAVVRSLLPLEHRWSVQLAEDEDGAQTGQAQRIYVGGMVQRECALAPPGKLRELAAPGLSLPQLHRLLRTINGTQRRHARAAGVEPSEPLRS